MIARRGMVMDPPVSSVAVAASADPVGAWLDLLERLMRLPVGEAAEIRAELESHVRERARDLMVQGLSEPDAVGRAVSEVGEAAEVARRYRAARHTSRRRTLMNLSMLGVAGSALVVSVAAFLRPGGPQPSVFQTVQGTALPAAKLQGSIHDMPLSEALPGLVTGQRALLRWTAIEGAGVARDAQVSAELSGLTLAQAITVLNEGLGLSGSNRMDARAHDGMVEFATEEYFDEAERVLASYDASAALRRGSAEEVIKVITSLAEPDSWVDNGGDLSRVHMLGERMFVEAPPRVHAKVKWILDQVAGEPAQVEGVPILGDVPVIGKMFKTEDGREARQYILKYASADEVLKTLESMQSIREVDFTQWAVDSHMNSIIGVETAAHHKMVQDTIKGLDIEKR